MIDLKLVECFSGAGMQRRGIENTGLYNVIPVNTCETDISAIIAYAAIHSGLTQDVLNSYDYPERERERMADDLSAMRIGYDFLKDKEYNWEKVARGKDSKQLLQRTWLACQLSKNVGDICRVEKFPECDMLTFSFPCTDLSVAGKGKGMVEGETRSGLVYEVLRIVRQMKKDGNAPTYLLMENVDALVNKKNKPKYEALNEEFAELGYSVKYCILNTKNTGIPQNRNRCYALYSLEDISDFDFPIPFDNGKRLEDILQDEVDDKYYITNISAQKLIDELILNGSLKEDE